MQAEVYFLFKLCDWLVLGEAGDSMMYSPGEMSDRLFSEERMYTYIKAYATMNSLNQTLRVLPYVREMHEGQFWRGRDHVPFVYHPITVACHAMALGLVDDNLISAALLHDVCEKCNVRCEDLPANDETREAVKLLARDWAFDREKAVDKRQLKK